MSGNSRRRRPARLADAVFVVAAALTLLGCDRFRAAAGSLAADDEVEIARTDGARVVRTSHRRLTARCAGAPHAVGICWPGFRRDDALVLSIEVAPERAYPFTACAPGADGALQIALSPSADRVACRRGVEAGWKVLALGAEGRIMTLASGLEDLEWDRAPRFDDAADLHAALAAAGYALRASIFAEVRARGGEAELVRTLGDAADLPAAGMHDQVQRDGAWGEAERGLASEARQALRAALAQRPDAASNAVVAGRIARLSRPPRAPAP